MRKLLVITPTWLLLGTLVVGFWLSTSLPKAGSIWIAFSTAGLGVYPVVVIFIAGIAKAARSENQFSRTEKWFYGYLLTVEIITILTAIYAMGHN